MPDITTDYLVVGAGASGMGFTDALIANSEADVLIVDRRHRPGGHWNDDYPFVRLHQPSAYYGVNSRPLGQDRIDESGPNGGFYERATGVEISDYYDRVLDEHLLATGRVRFVGMCDYRGVEGDEHVLVSLLTGARTTVRVRRKLVDATVIETTTPSRHRPHYGFDPEVRLITPNQLAALGDPGRGFTVIGAGKTSMDTCCWLIENGVAPDAIRWIRPRDPYTIDRGWMQPLTRIGSIAEWMALQLEAAAEADSGEDFVRRCEASGALTRLDPEVEPDVFRAAILSEAERTTLRSIENVVRRGRVEHIGTDRIDLQGGSIASDRRQIYVDCTAPGIGSPPPTPIFEPERISLQRVQFGIDCLGAGLIGHVEAVHGDDTIKNRLCPSVSMDGDVTGFPLAFLVSQRARMEWMADPEVGAWLGASRLTPFRDAGTYLGADPEAGAAFGRFMELTEPAIKNLERVLVT